MHCCGLRTGETRLLRPEHVHLRDQNLDVVSAKGNRSRRLPLTGEVTEVLAGCDRVSRARFGPSRRTFFVSTTGNQVTAATVGKMFHRIWDQAGLPRPAGGQQPRPYDFRHHFAYANVERWMSAGQGRHRDAALPGPIHGAREHRVELLLHPHLAGVPARLRRHHRREPVAAAAGRVRMKRDPATGAPDFYPSPATTCTPTCPRWPDAHRRRSRPTGSAWNASCTTWPTHDHVERAHVSFDHFDRQHLKGWLAWMSDQRHYAPRTIALRLTTVKAFLTYCSAEDITLVALSQAAKALRAPASARKPIEYLTEPETRAVLAAFTGRTAKSRRNRMLLILLYDTAARVGEITSLTLQDLCLGQPGHVRLTGKGDKTRIVPLTGKTIEHLRVYLAEFHPNTATLPARRPVFYSLHNGKPTALSTDTVAAVLKAPPHRAPNCPSVPEHIHCHMLRKTKAMDLYQQGIPLPIIMRLLGHENISTTAAFYAFATVDMMREAVNAATPAINSPPAQRLTEDKLQALYSLR